MEQDKYTLPRALAGASPLLIDLYSEHQAAPATKEALVRALTSAVPKQTGAKVLVLGAKCGLTAQLLLPMSAHLDLVEDGPYAALLHERFVKGREVSYFFAREGELGEELLLPAPKIEAWYSVLTPSKVRVFTAADFAGQLHLHYDMVVLQNCIISSKVNLVKELIKVEHDVLLTMLVPGYLLSQPYFSFVCTLEKLVLHAYYARTFHEQVESRRQLTGRRSEIYFMQVFAWKRASIDSEAQQKIHAILQAADKELVWESEAGEGNVNPYETQTLVEVYLNFHFGPNSLGVENFPAACARTCIEKAKEHNIAGGRALDLGCAVGRTSIDLAEHFDQVIGLDFSSAFIKAAQIALAENYQLVTHKVNFVVGDACNLSPSLGKFNLVFGGNLIDRLPDPRAFLASVGNFLEPKGLLVLTSPYSWLEEYTPKSKWVGGYYQDGKGVTTNEGLRRILTDSGFKEVSPTQDLRFSIKDNDWVYQYTLAWVTFWLKQ